jgi:hypothetical protein
MGRDRPDKFDFDAEKGVPETDVAGRAKRVGRKAGRRTAKLKGGRMDRHFLNGRNGRRIDQIAFVST